MGSYTQAPHETFTVLMHLAQCIHSSDRYTITKLHQYQPLRISVHLPRILDILRPLVSPGEFKICKFAAFSVQF
jgi:hypothetical protein